MLDNPALVIIDVQRGMFDEALAIHAGERVLATLADLVAHARASSVPVLYVQHAGGADHPLAADQPGHATHPQIAPLPGETVVVKHHPDAFHDTDLQAELARRNVQHLVLAGAQTEYCLDTTCRRAYSLGYAVTVVADGHTTWPDNGLSAEQIIDHHNAIWANFFARVVPASQVRFAPLVAIA